jgi:hypothetical protein
MWNLDGAVVESFSPDFYLPDLDLYLEMTTLRQKLVRKKNRKLRRLRELYPSVNIKLFYARDFRALMLKYGKHALVDGLSGSSGQVAVPHALGEEAAIAPQRTDALPGAAEQPVASPLTVSVIGTGRRPARRATPAAHEPETPGR